MAGDFDCVGGLEAFPHGVIVQLPQQSRLDQLDFAELSEVHVVEQIEPETLLDDLLVVHVVFGVVHLIEEELSLSELLFFHLDVEELFLQHWNILLPELVVLLIDQSEIGSVEVNN